MKGSIKEKYIKYNLASRVHIDKDLVNNVRVWIENNCSGKGCRSITIYVY